MIDGFVRVTYDCPCGRFSDSGRTAEGKRVGRDRVHARFLDHLEL